MVKKLITLSLAVLGTKIALYLLLTHIFSNQIDLLLLVLNWSLLVVVIIQILGIYYQKYQYLWIFSLIQCFLIIFTSEGTFGWFFSYLLKPLDFFRPYDLYINNGLLFLTEIIKTIWLYKKGTRAKTLDHESSYHFSGDGNLKA